MRFEGFAGRYPYHCHIIEHEDHEMMRQFEVVLPPLMLGAQKAGADINVTFRTTPNRRHFLDRRDNVAAGSWSTVRTNIPGTATNVTVTDPGAAARMRGFYRVGLEP